MTIFQDQQVFMNTMKQNPDAKLYWDLIVEEINETQEGWRKYEKAHTLENIVETVDGAIDSIYVLAGFLNSLVGPDKALQCWQEVQRSNMSKVGPDGVKYSETGKVMKPSGYSKPDLFSILANL